MFDSAGKTAVVEGGDGLTAAAAGVMQGISEVEAGPNPFNGLHQAGPIFRRECRHREKVLEHREHVGRPELVIAAQDPFEFESHGFR